MALNILRFLVDDQPRWGVSVSSKIYLLSLPCRQTADLLQYTPDQLRTFAASEPMPQMPKDEDLLSPITQPCKVLCQGANYRQHALESGMNPDASPFNLFFTKSSASIHTPSGAIIKPPHVEFLDYEIELALVLGKHTHQSVSIRDDNLHEYIAGICLANDISARDVQFQQSQFHKGKSYRSFCPLGPVLCLLDAEDMPYLYKMRLTLRVNGEIRQQDHTSNLIYKPAVTLSEFSQICDFAPGDVLLTGTPAGCALRLPSPGSQRWLGMLSTQQRWALFMKMQRQRREYLQEGDHIESSIISTDGTIDLGTQRHTVIF
ncbi:MAG: fumarylacetoacetate hydrolase family protein [Pseudomonadales bacterium]|nr:fumarylacetoacetate hydrolase family protein [Pseudomonadales bacterium]